MPPCHKARSDADQSARTMPPPACPTAAAICIGPESLVIKTVACRNKLGSKPTGVCPVRSTAFVRMSAITAGASGRSAAPPMNTIGIPCAATVRSAASAKCCGGQRLVSHRAEALIAIHGETRPRRTRRGLLPPPADSPDGRQIQSEAAPGRSAPSASATKRYRSTACIGPSGTFDSPEYKIADCLHARWRTRFGGRQPLNQAMAPLLKQPLQIDHQIEPSRTKFRYPTQPARSPVSTAQTRSTPAWPPPTAPIAASPATSPPREETARARPPGPAWHGRCRRENSA